MEVIFYTRKRCPLCEEAKVILQGLKKDYPIEIIIKDIETSDELTEKYGLMIPVVEIESEIVQYGVIDSIIIEEKIEKMN